MLEQCSGSFRSGYFAYNDSGIVADCGNGNSVAFAQTIAIECLKPMLAVSGALSLDSCVLVSDSFTVLDAYEGTAEVRITGGGFDAPDSSAAAISIGPNARLVAAGAWIEDSYIGIEVAGDGPDSVTNCILNDNALYGLYFNGGSSTGDSSDYSSDNVIENDTASAVNVGMHVLQQSLKSYGDSVKGGYNWVYNVNTYNTSSKAVTVQDAVILGKVGDDWGLVLNGISASNDVAVVENTEVLDRFSQAHVYVRQIEARVEECTIESTDEESTASPMGVYVLDNNTGYFGCTKISGQDECVKRTGSTSAIEWTDLSSSYANAGWNEFSTSLSYTFNNTAGDTVDVRRCFWGESPPDLSKMNDSGSTLNYASYLDSAQCGPGEPEAKVAQAGEVLPGSFALDQNYPNPFNPSTNISYSLKSDQPVILWIYNVLGQVVRTYDIGQQAAGTYTLTWNGMSNSGRPVGSGIYFYRIETPEFVDAKKMLLLR